MERGNLEGHLNKMPDQQKSMNLGEQHGSEHQTDRDKSLSGSDLIASEQLSNIGNMANSFLELGIETEYAQNISDSMQNIFPKKFQNLTGSFLSDNASPKQSKRSRSSLLASSTNGSGAFAQNDQFQEDSSRRRSNDGDCRNDIYKQPRTINMSYPCNDDSFKYIQRPASERKLPGHCEEILSPCSKRFLPYDQYRGVQKPTSGQLLIGQQPCEDIFSPCAGSFESQQDDWRYANLPGSWSNSNSGIGDSKTQQQKDLFPANKKEKKEKKSITTKTFAHGMMDVSLLTSNATHLRAVLSNPKYEFYTLLLWLIGLSIVLQLLSAVLLITSDFLKTQVKEKDRKNQGKRKLLNFLSLTLVTIVMSLNVLISAFSSPTTFPQQVSSNEVRDNIPVFSSQDIQSARSEL